MPGYYDYYVATNTLGLRSLSHISFSITLQGNLSLSRPVNSSTVNSRVSITRPAVIVNARHRLVQIKNRNLDKHVAIDTLAKRALSANKNAVAMKI